MFSVTSALLILSTLIPTLAAPHAHAHSHEERNPASLKIRNWNQDPSTASAQLFKRAPPTGTPGSPEWQAAYPAPGATPPNSSIPQAWLDRLAQVVASPGFPTFGPTQYNNGYPTYSNGKKGTDDDVCSFTYECIEEWDVASAPDGVIGLSFDDGPTTFSPQLYDYIEQHNISATHFMIGGNIYYNPATFQRAVNDGGHIAVHTWSHPYMTTLTNEQIVAELGWTAQIATDLMDGRVPAFWRPPYGDADNRVRYIAMEVFGLRTVPWNHDTGDWGIPSVTGYTHDSVVKEYTSWLTDPARKGIIALEHEASQADVDVFIAMYPIMIQNNWTIMNVAEANNMWEYTNAQDDSAVVGGVTDILQTAAPGSLTTYINNHAVVGGSVTSSGSVSSASSAVSSSVSSAASSASSAGSSAASSSAAGSSATVAQSTATGSSRTTPTANTAAASSPTSSTGAATLSSSSIGFAGSLLGLGLALLV